MFENRVWVIDLVGHLYNVKALYDCQSNQLSQSCHITQLNTYSEDNKDFDVKITNWYAINDFNCGRSFSVCLQIYNINVSTTRIGGNSVVIGVVAIQFLTGLRTLNSLLTTR